MRKISNLKTQNSKLKKSAALIIALLIITVLSTIVLAFGRQVVQSASSTGRFAESTIAEQLAWSGIEDGLMRLKIGNWTAYFPNFVENVGVTNYQNVMRRNITEQSGTSGESEEIAGYFLTDTNIPGFKYTDQLRQSCHNYGLKCDENKWSDTDQYYDLRVSGSDDDILASIQKRMVNAKPDVSSPSGTSPIISNGFYKVSTSTDKIFDLSNYAGNKKIGSDEFAINNNQKIIFLYDATNLSAGSNVKVEFYVKYKAESDIFSVPFMQFPPAGWDNPWSLRMNKHLFCYDQNTNPFRYTVAGVKGNFAEGNYFITKNVDNNVPIPNISSGTGFISVYIPQPCDYVVFKNNIEYLTIRFTFLSGSGSLYYGLTTASNADGEAYPYSFIGTGVTKLLSTGIFGSTKKTIEVWAAKKLKLNTATIPNNYNEGDAGEALRCDNAASSADLKTCAITIYRQTQN